MMTDIDHFKTFNDTFGHLTGDQVLRLVALSVKQNVKGQDLAARYGGEEFAVILPDTVLRSGVTVADHIRRAVMTKELMKRSTGEHLGRVTISIGVATLRPEDSAASLIGRADQCLYAAKRNGRNQVVCETDPEVVVAARKRRSLDRSTCALKTPGREQITDRALPAHAPQQSERTARIDIDFDITNLRADLEIVVDRLPDQVAGIAARADGGMEALRVQIEREITRHHVRFPMLRPNMMIGADDAPAFGRHQHRDRAGKARQIGRRAEIRRRIHRISRLHAECVAVSCPI